MARSKMVPLAARQMLPRLPGKVTPPGTQPSWITIPLERWSTTAPEPISPDHNPHNPPGNKTSLLQNHPLEHKPLEHDTPGTQQHNPLDPWTPGTHNLYGPTHWCACRIQCVNVSALLALWGV